MRYIPLAEAKSMFYEFLFFLSHCSSFHSEAASLSFFYSKVVKKNLKMDAFAQSSPIWNKRSSDCKPLIIFNDSNAGRGNLEKVLEDR